MSDATSAGADAIAGSALSPWGALAGGALGLIQGLIGQQQNQRQRQIAATTQAWSPWTGMKGQDPGQAASPLTTGLGGALTGMALQGAMNPGSGGGNSNLPVEGPSSNWLMNPQVQAAMLSQFGGGSK